MRTLSWRTTVLALVLAFSGLLAACDSGSDNDVTTTSGLDDPVATTNAEDESFEDSLADLQSQMAALAEDIENSEAADELGDAWAELQAEVAEATTALTSGAAFDTTELQQGIDAFEDQLDTMGGEAGDELQSAWAEVRSTLEDLVS